MKKVILLVLIIALISPLHLYAKWHLQAFSGGLLYTLFNVTYIPYDYKRPIWSGVLENRTPVERDLLHKYKGIYEIYVSGNVVKDKSLEFEVVIECDGQELTHLSEKDVKATDLFRETHEEVMLGRYLIEHKKNFYGCRIELISRNFDTPIYMRIVKWTHW